jgi:hypothetical protein
MNAAWTIVLKYFEINGCEKKHAAFGASFDAIDVPILQRHTMDKVDSK